MLVGPRGDFWIVTTPSGRDWELADVLFRTNLEGLRRQFLGGLKVEGDCPTIYSLKDEEAARRDAEKRLAVARGES